MTDKTNIVTKSRTDAAIASAGQLGPVERAAVIASPGDDDFIETDFNTPKRIGLWIAFAVFGVFGLWSAFAQLDAAAVAPGTITVESYKKVIQHLEGGIVRDIRVKNGDSVKVGDIMLVLDRTQPLSQLGIANTQLKSLLAAEARLIAERDDLDTVAYPAELDPSDSAAKAEIDAQNQVFHARKRTREGEIAVLEQQIGQLRTRIEGLKAVKISKEELAASYADELEDFRALLDEGFADKLRLRDLERSHAIAKGEAADLTANIAAAEIQAGETQLKILQLQNQFQSEVAKELSEAQTKLHDVRERRTALSDVVQRTDVEATADGVVTGLQVHTIGGVIPPGQIIAEIVPQTDKLIVEAQVSPVDRDRIAMGQEATVRMSAFNSRLTPTLFGTVIGISADAMAPPENGRPYYLARVEIKPESLAELDGQELVPGMPAEVFITTGSRTFLQILMKSLTDSVSRSFRED